MCCRHKTVKQTKPKSIQTCFVGWQNPSKIFLGTTTNATTFYSHTGGLFLVNFLVTFRDQKVLLSSSHHYNFTAVIFFFCPMSNSKLTYRNFILPDNKQNILKSTLFFFRSRVISYHVIASLSHRKHTILYEN